MSSTINLNYMNLTAIVAMFVVGFILVQKKLIKSEQWGATVTPLASIIGSGFLIVAPLLHSVFGKWALVGILILLILGYGIGSVIRFNIENAEIYLLNNPNGYTAKLEKLSQVALGISYAISVAFYISLFTSFISKELNIVNSQTMNWMTTGTLLSIMGISWWRGTRGLEKIELIAVTIKLAVIGGVLFSLANYAYQTQSAWFEHDAIRKFSILEKLSMLAGMLMITQGFETTRFMGERYESRVRVKAARNSQLIAMCIYLLFIGLTCPIFLNFPIVQLNETAVSVSLGRAISILPILLLGAAIASQLSAALADTLGGGGLLKEIIPSKLKINTYYMMIIAVAIFLIWTANIFEIINFSSKGFALYFLLQTIIAFKFIRMKVVGIKKYFVIMGCALLQIALVFVILFSIPAPHS